jgi:ATP-dependent Clp protease ATP-binding subunit ClpB
MLEDRKITLNIDNKAKEWLAKEGYDPVYGARPLKRVIQRSLQNELATKILDGSIIDQVNVTANKDGLIIRS